MENIKKGLKIDENVIQGEIINSTLVQITNLHKFSDESSIYE